MTKKITVETAILFAKWMQREEETNPMKYFHFSDNDMFNEYVRQHPKVVVEDDDSIPVSKIRERIEELKSHIGFAYATSDRINELEQLLEGEK